MCGDVRIHAATKLSLASSKQPSGGAVPGEGALRLWICRIGMPAMMSGTKLEADPDRIFDLKLDRSQPALLAVLEQQPLIADVSAVRRGWIRRRC